MMPWQIRPHYLLWLLKTHGLKTWIGLEERYGLFNYRRWIKQNEPGSKILATQRASTSSLETRPLISVVLVPSLADGDFLVRRTRASLEAQTYPNWTVMPVERRNSFAVETRPAGTDTVPQRPQSANWFLETLLKESRGEWVIFLAAGDTLSPHAFYAAITVLQADPQADVLYSDEDHLASDGLARHRPFCKPDFSPDLLLSVNYLRGALFRRERLLQSACLSASSEETVLRCTEMARRVIHLPHILLHTHQESTSFMGDLSGFYCRTFSVVERAAYLHRSGLRQPHVEIMPMGERFIWESDQPLVSIIIPSKDNIEYLRRCIESIQRITDYPHYEIIIVDNDSCHPATLDYYAHLPGNVRVLENHDTFNYSAYNNRGAKVAQGDLLLFLNNDVEIIEAHWLDELARWAERPDVGAVGAKLLYPDQTIQHAGIVIGMEGHSSHVFGWMTEDADGPWGRPNWYRNVSALTGACLMMRRQVFEQIGGFDEQYLLVFNDVEINVRTLAHGYRVVYNPFVRLFHYEGKSRGHYIPPADIRLGFQHLKDIVANGDPYYNSQLSYAVRRPTLRRASEEARWKRLETILAMFGQDK